MEFYVKSVTCCFTGHRKLEHTEKKIKSMLLIFIEQAIIKKGYNHFICGGAVGFDTIAAETVLCLKNKFSHITLEIAIPCLNQTKKWNNEQKGKYEDILKQADKTTLISQVYNPYCMQLRNKYMVDNSTLIIAYFNNKSGGTKNTIEYAKRQNKEVLYIL